MRKSADGGSGAAHDDSSLVPFLHARKGMARGWESKSVESQQTETFGRGARRKESSEDIERRAKRESLELSRSRVSHELEGARSPVHRTALENALKYLDDELRKT